MIDSKTFAEALIATIDYSKAKPPVEVPDSPGITVQELSTPYENIHALWVKCPPNSAIPIHTHSCASGMGITKGSAIATGKATGDIKVKTGDYIYKIPNQSHGFTVEDQGLEFISLSDKGGILANDNWDFELATS